MAEAESESVERVMSGKSWEEFCDTLKAAGQTIRAEGSPDNVLDRAEGYRYLSRLARAALETFIEHADPLAPVLHRPIHETAITPKAATPRPSRCTGAPW